MDLPLSFEPWLVRHPTQQQHIECHMNGASDEVKQKVWEWCKTRLAIPQWHAVRLLEDADNQGVTTSLLLNDGDFVVVWPCLRRGTGLRGTADAAPPGCARPLPAR